jgi:hypothetical protein
MKHVVIYQLGGDLTQSPIFDTKQEAIDFVYSDEGAGDEKAIIVSGDNIETEDHT